MAEQVARDAVAALVELEAPRQQPERVRAVHREEAAAVVRDLAELARGDQLAHVAHQRRPAVVVTDPGGHAGAACGALGPHGLLGRAADGLLAEDVLAGLRGRLDHLHVDHVRRRDVDDVDGRVVHHAPPVLRAAGEAERADRVLDARGHRVAADHQLGVEVALPEQRADALQRAAVGLAEPAEADHADADPAPRTSRRRCGWLAVVVASVSLIASENAEALQFDEAVGAL